MVTRILLCLLLTTPVFAQRRGNPEPFMFGFGGGLNLRDDPVTMGTFGRLQPFAVGATNNGDFLRDGSFRKRPGSVFDGAIDNSENTPVNLLAYDPFHPGYEGPFTFVWGQSGDNRWAMRFNQDTELAGSSHSEGDWRTFGGTSIIPETLRWPTDAQFRYENYNGRLIIGGELSDAINPVFGRTANNVTNTIVRAFLPPAIDTCATATASNGGSLDASTTYYYVYTFESFHSSASGTREESYSSPACSVTTTDANLTVDLTNILRYPEYAFVTTAHDTTKLASGRRIYRSTDGGTFAYLTTLLDPRASSFTDNGTLTPDLTLLAPIESNLLTNFSAIESHADFLWTVGTGGERLARWQLDSQIGPNDEDSLLTLDVGFGQNRGVEVKEFMTAADITLTSYTTRQKLTATTAQFLTNGVVPGDYVVHNDTTKKEKEVIYVLSETELVIEGTLTGGFTTHYSVGNNLFKVEDEVIGLIYQTASDWVIQRGLFETDIATHAAAVQGFEYSGNKERSYLRISEVFNPQRYIPIQQGGESFGDFDNPVDVTPGEFGDITALASGDILTVFKEDATYGMYGNSPSTFQLVPLANGIGCISPNSLGQFRGWNFFLDNNGVYAQTQGQFDDLSDILGGAIADSSATLYLNESPGVVHDGRYYLGVMKDYSTREMRTWVYDIHLGLWTKYTNWSPHVFARWPEASDKAWKLYYGDWKNTGNVYEVSPSATDDASAAITCVLQTPRFHYEDNSDAWFEELHLSIDTDDSVRVSFEIGAFDSTFTLTPENTSYLSTLSPTAGDTSFTAGVPSTFIFPIRAAGNTCQVTIWTSGTGRMTIYPSKLIAWRKGI